MARGLVPRLADAYLIDICQDLPNWLREIHAHEGADAGALNFQNVVVTGDGEIVA